MCCCCEVYICLFLRFFVILCIKLLVSYPYLVNYNYSSVIDKEKLWVLQSWSIFANATSQANNNRNIFIEPKLSSTFFGQPNLLSSYVQCSWIMVNGQLTHDWQNTYTYMGLLREVYVKFKSVTFRHDTSTGINFVRSISLAQTHSCLLGHA